MNQPPKVIIIILNWNSENDTIECLKSLHALEYGNYSIVIVDNASIDGSIKKIKKEFPNDTVLYNTMNLGYTGGNNIGIKYAMNNSADYVWLLNSDTVVEPNTLKNLIHEGEASPEAGLLSPVVYYCSKRDEIQQCGATIDFRNYRITTMRELKDIKDNNFNKTYLLGTALLIKKETIKKIGLLNEKYFAYSEDLDYSMRSLKAGFINKVVLDANVYHKEHDLNVKGVHALPPHYFYYTVRNQYWTWKENISDINKIRFIRSYLSKTFKTIGFCKENEYQAGLSACFEGMYAAFNNIHGEWNKQKKVPNIIKTFLGARPYLLADLLDLDFKKIIIKILPKMNMKFKSTVRIGDIHKTNILFFESSSGFGGSANALAGLINNLDRQKYKPIIAVTKLGSQTNKIKDAEFILIKGLDEPNTLSNVSFLFYFLKSIVPQAIAIYLLIKRQHVTLIHINNNIIAGIPAIIASKIANVPCVCYIRQNRDLIKREKIFSSWVNKFIILNKFAYDLLAKYIPASKIKIIHDGIDLTNYPNVNGNFRKELDIDASFLVVGMVSRIVDGKGCKEFVQSIKKTLKSVPKAKFVIVGDAKGSSVNYYNEVRELAKNNQLEAQIAFVGWRTDIKNVISSFDVLAQPSTFPEGFGLTCVEAMALKKPVVATNIGGAVDIVVHGETGFLVPPKDPVALAEAITDLLNDSNLAKKMGEAGRKRAEELFDIRKNVKQIETLYEEVLANQA